MKCTPSIRGYIGSYLEKRRQVKERQKKLKSPSYEEQKKFEWIEKKESIMEEIEKYLSFPMDLIKIVFIYSTPNSFIPHNAAAAFPLYQDLASQGHTWAQGKLAECYQRGYGTIKKPELAFYYAQLSSSTGDAEGYAALGCCYLEGIGVEQNLLEATRLYQISANAKNPRGMLSLGCRFMNLNQEKSIEGSKLIKEAANLGDTYAIGYLGIMYRDGFDQIKRNPKKAIKCFENAINFGLIRFHYDLGKCYALGLGTKMDMNKAYESYSIAAEYGIPCAQMELGSIYDFGLLCKKKNKEKAIYWYKLAAKQGDEIAKKRLNKFGPLV